MDSMQRNAKIVNSLLVGLLLLWQLAVLRAQPSPDATPELSVPSSVQTKSPPTSQTPDASRENGDTTEKLLPILIPSVVVVCLGVLIVIFVLRMRVYIANRSHLAAQHRHTLGPDGIPLTHLGTTIAAPAVSPVAKAARKNKKAKKEDITVLSEALMRHFEPKRVVLQRWEAKGEYKFHPFFAGSLAWTQMEELVHNDLDGHDVLSAGAIVSAVEIFNARQFQDFKERAEYLKLMMKRDAANYDDQDWKEEADHQELRKWIHEVYEKKVVSCRVNNDGEKVKILPAVIGLPHDFALSVCDSGFTSEHFDKQGVFGEGLYFSTSMNYAAKKALQHKDPSILVCFVITGNAYPAVENGDDEDDSLKGKLLKSGFQSHFALVNSSDGKPCTAPKLKDFVEVIVIDRTYQIVPLMLLKISKAKLDRVKIAPVTTTGQSKTDSKNSRKSDKVPSVAKDPTKGKESSSVKIETPLDSKSVQEQKPASGSKEATKPNEVDIQAATTVSPTQSHSKSHSKSSDKIRSKTAPKALKEPKEVDSKHTDLPIKGESGKKVDSKGTKEKLRSKGSPKPESSSDSDSDGGSIATSSVNSSASS